MDPMEMLTDLRRCSENLYEMSHRLPVSERDDSTKMAFNFVSSLVERILMKSCCETAIL